MIGFLYIITGLLLELRMHRFYRGDAWLDCAGFYYQQSSLLPRYFL